MAYFFLCLSQQQFPNTRSAHTALNLNKSQLAYKCFVKAK
nr:MAG TPA: hypothetical protein [Caudoviricetes sp.]